MVLAINTNVASLTAQRQIARTESALGRNISRLSSGLRINTAGDDAAGLALSERLKSYARGTSQAERNAGLGVSMLQTAEGGLNEISGLLVRMRELAVQSGNGTLTTQERSFLQTEFVQLRSEVDRIADVTEFNGRTLLNGNAGTLSFQVGIHSGSNYQISTTIDDVNAAAIGSGTGSQLSNSSVTTSARALAALNIIDNAIDDISDTRADIGSVQNRLQASIGLLQSNYETLMEANSRIRDVDIAMETAELTKNNILMQAGVAVLSQANQLPSLALDLLGGR